MAKNRSKRGYRVIQVRQMPATWLPLLAWLGVLGGCGSIPPIPPPGSAVAQSTPAVPAELPVPAGLEPQVAFWSQVYGHWTLGQAVLHDDRHLGLVYGIAALPEPVNDDYRPDQRAFVKARLGRLRSALSELERKITEQQPLTDIEQRLADFITRKAGPQALIGAADRLRSQRGLRQRFRRGLAISGRYSAEFERIFKSAGVPVELALLPHVESSFQMLARSSAGATGMWQFTRSTGKHFLQINRALDERLDPVAAAHGAARLLRDAFQRLHSWPLAVTAYNHGVGGMWRAQQQFGNDFGRIVKEFDGKRFGFASRNFYAEFLAARRVAGNIAGYFPEGVVFESPRNYDRITLLEPVAIAELALRYDLSVADLAALNPAWKRAAVENRIPLPVATDVWLPPGATGEDDPDDTLKLVSTGQYAPAATPAEKDP